MKAPKSGGWKDVKAKGAGGRGGDSDQCVRRRGVELPLEVLCGSLKGGGVRVM